MRQFRDQRYPRIKGSVRVGKSYEFIAATEAQGPFGLGPLGRLLARRQASRIGLGRQDGQ